LVSIAIVALLTLFSSIAALGMAFGATIPIPYDYDKGVFEITDVSLYMQA
jgi:hypothetical protein